VGGHGGGVPPAGGIMFPQKTRAGRLELPRTAVAGVAGVGEDLRRRLAGVEVRLGAGVRGGDRERSAENPRGYSTSLRYHVPPSPRRLAVCHPLLRIFGYKEVRKRPHYYLL